MMDFDTAAATWDADPRKVEMARSVAAVIRRRVPLSKSMTSFEYGCGTGLLSLNLLPFLKSARMADVSDGMLEELRGKVRRLGLEGVVVEKLDLTEDFEPRGSHDLLCSQMALHHIADAERLLEVFWRMLNPSGWLCLADLDEEDGTFHGADFQGHNGFNREKLAATLEKIGFEEAGSEIGFEITKEARDGVVKTFPVFVMTARKPAVAPPA